MDQVEEIKNKVDIVQLVGEYVKLAKAGRNFKGLCPFHGEKTPSFMVNPELQIYKCFGCGEGGDVYSFMQKMEGVEFGEALRTLAKRVGVTLDSYLPTKGEEDRDRLYKINHLAAEFFHYLLTKHPKGEPARKYIKQRKISPEAIEVFNLGFVPEGWDFLIKYLVGKKNFKIDDLTRAGLVIDGRYDRFRNRIMFPLNNHRGQTVGFAGRILPGIEAPSFAKATEGQAKYINTPETEIYHKGDLLYGLDVNKGEIKKANNVIVVEGEIDAIASWQAGVKNVVAVKGSALTVRQVELLRRLTDRMILGMDADLAGGSAGRRGIEIAEKAGLFVETVDWSLAGGEEKDVADVVSSNPGKWVDMARNVISIYSFYIDTAVKKFGLSAEGKSRVARDVLGFLSGIGDEIRKDEYLKELAVKIGAEMDVLREEMKKQSTFTEAKEVKPSSNEPIVQGRRDVVEENLVKMAILGGRVKELGDSEAGKMITGRFWARVVEELAGGKEIKDLPGEIKLRVQELLMDETEYSQEEWDELVRQLELVTIEEGMELSKGNPARVRDLGIRKQQLTKDW
jgi:DNA primase